MSSDQEESRDQKKPGARWIGVLLSFFVPGFGLVRAGETRRGIFWFVGFQMAAVIVAFVVVLDSVPIGVGFASLAVLIVFILWMLFDSFRSGRMTGKLSLLYIALFLGLILIPPLPYLIGKAYRVPTGAMEPTVMGIHEGSTPDHVYADKIAYLFFKPERGDLIAFRTASISGILPFGSDPKAETIFLKRIVGLPGERIEIRDGSVFANGVKLEEGDGIPPIHYTTEKSIKSSAKRDGDAFLVGENEYFVLGDNSGNSFDSRFWGCVPSSNIVGKITKIYYPFNRMGKPRYPTDKAP